MFDLHLAKFGRLKFTEWFGYACIHEMQKKQLLLITGSTSNCLIPRKTNYKSVKMHRGNLKPKRRDWFTEKVATLVSTSDKH